MSRIISISVRQADKNLVHEVEQIAANPGDDLTKVQGQIKTLALALVAVANHCEDLDKVIQTLLKNAKIQSKE